MTTAAALGLVGGSVAAETDSYDVIEVPAGSTHTIQLGSGEKLTETLIDITADGATYQITAIGSDWEISNVGVRGVWDRYEKAEPLIVSVPDGTGSARIENLYLGDGAYDDTYPGATGIYVAKTHAGVLEIDRVNIQGYPDNAIYGSSPGDTSAHPSGRGSGGRVEITNSFAGDCRAGGFRVGTNGSLIENCVAVGCDRNVWGFYNGTDVVDCDLSNGRIGDIGTGDSHWRANATVTATNTRFESTVEHSGQVVGESVGTPQRTEPGDVEGVPLRAEDAASGASGRSTADESDADTGAESNESSGDHLLAFVTDPKARFASYEFTADGAVAFTEAPYNSPSGDSIEGGTYADEDFIEETDEGVSAGGVTGGGFGDAFLVDGPITAIDIDQPDVMWVELDGEELSPEAIIEATAADGNEADDRPENVLIIDGTATPESVTYSFSVSGSIEPATYGEATINDDATVDENSVDAVVDDSVDAYWFSGSFTGFRLAGNANVSVEYDAR